MNFGGFLISIGCFLMFYAALTGERKEILKKIWQTYLFAFLGIWFIVISFLPPIPANIGFELGVGMMLYACFSVIIYFYRINLMWIKYSSTMRKIFYIGLYILRIMVILWYIFRAFIWWFGGIYLR